MKKLIGAFLVLMIAVTGLAFAETTGSTVQAADGYLLICLKQDDEETLALIGAGDGTDVFEALSADGDTYSEQYERLWKVASLFRPETELEGSAANLRFERGAAGDTHVTLNGVVIARLKGAESFAILSGDERPSVQVGCEVRLWTEGSVGTAGELCANCGMVNDGGDEHETVISQFCDQHHTECMGDPIHHCDSCDQDYPCSRSGSHTPCAVCGKPWCDKEEGDHVELECGHRGCEVYGNEDAHALCMICGGYVCDGEDHTAAACGLHHASDAGSHTACENGDGWLCDGKNHNHADELPEGEVIVDGDA